MAQFTIQIGISRDKAIRAMIAGGYTQIEVFDKGFKTIRARACLNGTRYNVRVDHKYRVQSEQRLGACRRQISPEVLKINLEKNGFTRVVIDQQNGKYVAIGCANSQRLRAIYDRQGQLLKQTVLGRCDTIFEPNDVRKVLLDRGYDRVQFIDRQLPWYRAHACQNNRKFELLLTRYGEISRSTRVGDCNPPLNPRNLERFLTAKGYEQVVVLDDRLPRYAATGCFKNKQYELELDRYGEIHGRTEIGRCPSVLKKADLIALLEKEGFERIVIETRRSGDFGVNACYKGFKKFATISKFGELLAETDGNRCDPRSIANILDGMQANGFQNIRFFTESCRDGSKFRFTYDRRGDRINQERIGNC